MTFTTKEVETEAGLLTTEQIEFMRQVRAHKYPHYSPLLNELEERNLLWQEGHQDSVVVTHFGAAVLNYLGNLA